MAGVRVHSSNTNTDPEADMRPFALLLSLTLALPAFAEKAPMTPERKRKSATHVVVAGMNGYKTTAARRGGYDHKSHVASAKIIAVEKGDLSPGARIDVHFWTQRWVGAGMPPPGTNGHAPVPPAKGPVAWRIYLTKKKDGTFHVLFKDGFEPTTLLKHERVAGKTFEAAMPDGSTVSWTFGADGALTVRAKDGLPAATRAQLLGKRGAKLTVSEVTGKWAMDPRLSVILVTDIVIEGRNHDAVMLPVCADASGTRWYLGGGVIALKK